MTAGIAAVFGYLVYAAVEVFIHHGSFEHGHPPGEDTAEPHEHLPATSLARNGLGWIGPAGLIVHSTLDGLAIGLGFEASAELGLLVLAAVLVHDFADGLNVVTLAFAGGRGRRAALVLLGLDAAAPILGIALSQVVAVAPQTLGPVAGRLRRRVHRHRRQPPVAGSGAQAARKRFALVALTIAGAVLRGGRSHDCRLNPSTSPT